MRKIPYKNSGLLKIREEVRKSVWQQDFPINLITVADTINRYYSSVERISKENRHTVKVILTDREEANHLPQNPTFTPSYCVYVPCRYVEIDGIVDEPGLKPTELIKHGVGKFRNPRMESQNLQQKCSRKVTPLFTLPQLVSLICDATGVEDNWREIINKAMPFWKHLWKFIVIKIPELDHLVTC
ncbi:conserved hypothetical protein [Culex quinquefasciatus]|uniref:Uncharacterized protein n=1 Tax=Culex quinquefasciatus TaxID=7176 RepID=B0X950_CULQU|nr:conserved hypothetical protein [Culex quinquefasciatus]|eukprot:XP_001866172.1 conserved hypothetical protein [Culex quinquefasciatus]